MIVLLMSMVCSVLLTWVTLVMLALLSRYIWLGCPLPLAARATKNAPVPSKMHPHDAQQTIPARLPRPPPPPPSPFAPLLVV